MIRTRDCAIEHHVNMAVKHTALTREVFADEVVALYHARTPLHQRNVRFHQLVKGGDPYQVQRLNAQLLFRMFGGPVRLASELEEAVVLALPEPYRSACLAELAGRYGLMAAPQPADTYTGHAAQVGDLAVDFGSAFSAISATMADGSLDHLDANAAPKVISELDELIATATTLRKAHALLIGAPAPAAATATAPLERH